MQTKTAQPLRRCIRIYDERAGTSKVATLGERSTSAPWERVRSLRWARDGARLVSGGGGTALRIWDVRQRAAVHEWRLHEDTVWAVHGDENLRTVYSGGRDGKARTSPAARHDVLLQWLLPVTSTWCYAWRRLLEHTRGWM